MVLFDISVEQVVSFVKKSFLQQGSRDQAGRRRPERRLCCMAMAVQASVGDRESLALVPVDGVMGEHGLCLFMLRC